MSEGIHVGTSPLNGRWDDGWDVSWLYYDYRWLYG